MWLQDPMEPEQKIIWKKIMLTKIKYKYNVNILESNSNKQTTQE